MTIKDLMDAIRNGNLQKVQEIIESDPNLINQNDHYTSPLDRAVIGSNLEIVEYLINNGANVNYIDQNGGHILTKLISFIGEDEKIRTTKDKIFELIVKHESFDPNNTTKLNPLIFFAVRLDDNKFRIFLENPKLNLSVHDQHGYTPMSALIFLYQNLDLKKFELLLSKIDVNFANQIGLYSSQNGNTALHDLTRFHGLYKEFSKALEMLFEHPNLNLNIKNNANEILVHHNNENNENKLVTSVKTYNDTFLDIFIKNYYIRRSKDTLKLILDKTNVGIDDILRSLCNVQNPDINIRDEIYRCYIDVRGHQQNFDQDAILINRYEGCFDTPKLKEAFLAEIENNDKLYSMNEVVSSDDYYNHNYTNEETKLELHTQDINEETKTPLLGEGETV